MFVCAVAIAVVVHVVVAPSFVLAVAQDGRASMLPVNIQVGPALQPVAVMLLRQSETFRRQCAALAAARHVRVGVNVAARSQPASQGRARTTIERYTQGALLARVELPALGDHAELLPHELEHVIEQIEGWDLPALARLANSGVYVLADGSFETARAARAGLVAAREVYDGTDPALQATRRSVTRALRAIGARARPAERATRAPARR